MPAAKDNPGKYDNEASRRQRQNNQVSLAKAVMNQRLAKLQVGSTGRFDFPPRKEISNPTSQVVTNHFEVRLKNDIKLYEYRLVFTAGTRVRRKIKALVERAIESTDALRLNREHFATDYFDTIIAWKSLDESLGQPIVGTGTTRSWPLTALQDGQQPIAFDLRFERVVDVDTLVNYTQSDPATHNWDHAVVTRALNVIIFDSFVKSNEPTVQIGANKFYLRRAHEDLGQYSKGQLAPISRSLCTIRGYFYTVKPGIDKVLLNVNTATSAFFKPQLVSQLMLDDWTWGPNNIPADQLRGLRVRINYQRGDPKDVETFDRLNSEDGRSKVIENLGESVDRQIFTPKDANGNDLPSTTVANHLLTSKYATFDRKATH
jgi:eukaryotic translation initiation factor 2C